MRVDVAGHDVGLASIPVNLPCGSRVVDRIDQVKDLHRFITKSQACEGDHGPRRRVRVLAAVLANTWQVSLDVPRIVRGAIERRRQQEHESCVPPEQMRPDGLHRLAGAHGLTRAGKYGP